MAASEKSSLRNPILARFAIRGKRKISLQVVPMVDIIFLLLIFFLMAGQWRDEENFLPFKLPVATAGLSSVGRPEPMVLQISKTQDGCSVQPGQGQIIEIRDKQVEEDLACLINEIKNCMQQQKRFASDPIQIVCDGKVRWEQVVKIYNLLYGAGASDITFTMTEQGHE